MKKPPATLAHVSFLVLTIAAATQGCGSPDSTGAAAEGLTPVRGRAAFGSQCPMGTYDQPVAAKLQLWNCPTGLPNVEFAEPLEPLIFQADCKKKTLSVRRLNRSMDTFWNLMPDGTFSISVEAGYARLKSDGPGRGECSIPISADVSGKVDCSDRDKAIIPVETVWWPGRVLERTSQPRPSASPTPGAILPMNYAATGPESPSGPRCQMASSCYFYAAATIKQCQ